MGEPGRKRKEEQLLWSCQLLHVRHYSADCKQLILHNFAGISPSEKLQGDRETLRILVSSVALMALTKGVTPCNHWDISNSTDRVASKQQKFICHHLEAEVWDRGHGQVRVLFWVADFLLCPHMVKEAKDSLRSLTRAPIPLWGPCLIA